MKTTLLMRTLIVMLALEWELGSQDPVIFCYRIGASLCEPSSEDSAIVGESISSVGYTCLP